MSAVEFEVAVEDVHAGWSLDCGAAKVDVLVMVGVMMIDNSLL